MSYFSRLTDIVTCNLTEMLAAADDPAAALREIVAEMEEGLQGAQRCVDRAGRSRDELAQKLGDYRAQAQTWMTRAEAAITSGDEDGAREALLRKGEVEDLIAGLDREFEAAQSNCDSLATTMRALEARLADARRRQQQVDGDHGEPVAPPSETPVAEIEQTIEASRSAQIEDELAQLKRRLGQD